MSFKDFSEAMAKKHVVPTLETCRVVGNIRALDGLQQITGKKASEGLEAGRFYQHGVKATQQDDWRNRFGYEGVPASPVKQLNEGQKQAPEKAEKQAFNPKPSPFGNMA